MGSASEKRKERIEFLARNYIELSLANYPWGLSTTRSEERVKRYNKELNIINAMRKANLLSDSTKNCDVNLNNMILDAKKIFNKNKRGTEHDSRKAKMDQKTRSEG